MTDVRSLYKPDVDFAALASQSPPFNKLYAIPVLSSSQCLIELQSQIKRAA